MTVVAFAERMGVTENAVRKAIRSGRLERSITRQNGVYSIADVALAEQEWKANRDVMKSRNGGPDAPGTIMHEKKLLIRAQRKREELRADTMAGKLLEESAVRATWAAMVLRARTRFLGHATRMKQQIPELTPRQLTLIDDDIRATLDELAADAGVDEAEEANDAEGHEEGEP